MKIKNYFPLSLRSILIILMFALTSAMFVFNFFTYKYQVPSFLSALNILMMLPGFLLYIFGGYIKDTHTNLAYVLQSLWIIILISLAVTSFATVIQYTPFDLQDARCQEWDVWLHFNLIAFTDWVHQHSTFTYILKRAYVSIVAQTLLLPMVLALCQQRRQFDVYLNAMMSATIIGFLIYYFFPTTTPSHILNDPHFTPFMRTILERFYAIRNHIPYNNINAGIIGLPSFHSIWAMIGIYSVRKYKFAFYPFLIWNSLIIFSTVGLGWHFLVDTIASVFVVIISIIIAERYTVAEDLPYEIVMGNYRRELGGGG